MTETALSRAATDASNFRRILASPDLRKLAICTAFLAVYWMLDRADAALSGAPMQPAPWDLSGGLAFAFLLFEGPWFAPLAALAEVLSGRLNSGAHAPLPADLMSALDLAVTYAIAAWLLRRRGSVILASQRDLTFLAVAAIGAAAVRAAADMAIAFWMSTGQAGNLAGLFGERFTAFLAGVAVMAPLMMAFRPSLRGLTCRLILERTAQFAVLIATCALVMPPAQADTFRYFYLLFLPQIWIAIRGGLAGAALGNLVVQGALMIFLLNRPDTVALSFNYQVRLLAVTVSTLFLAVAVTERRAFEAALRQRQDTLARVSRLSLAGEMAGALAHELNQPLAAAIAFARAAQKLAGEGVEPRVGEALDGAVRQAERAGAIVKGLRRFIGRSDRARAAQDIETLAREAVDLVELRRQQADARIQLIAERDLPLVMADGIQLQQVMVNLLQNALDSVEETADAGRLVKLVARRTAAGLEVETKDSGPGVAEALAETLFEPMISGKVDGMGLGLSISRGIIEAHGGQLWLAENRTGRCVFRFTLPIAVQGAARDPT